MKNTMGPTLNNVAACALALLLAITTQLRNSLKRPHALALKDARLFEAAFSDSGHWDFVILAAMEGAARTVIVFTTSPVSELSFVEKASWVGLGLSALGGVRLPTAGAAGLGAVFFSLS